jgi:hypothetical protein
MRYAFPRLRHTDSLSDTESRGAIRVMGRPITAVNRLYIGLSLLVAAIALTGFWPTYFGPLVRGIVEKPPVIHVHAAVYSGWVLLFLAQILFAATGRIAQHRRLGRIGIYYGIALIAVGVFTAFTQFEARIDAGNLAEAQRFILAPLSDMIVFALFFGAAIYYRRKPEIHKRLMLVATTTLLVAAVARMGFIGDPFAREVRLLVWVSPILLAMGYDLCARRFVHPVYIAGLAALVLLNQRRFLVPTDAWQSFSAWLATLVT